MDKIIIQDNFLNKEQLENCIRIVYDGQWNYKLNNLHSDNIFWTMDLLNNQYINNITKLIGKTFSKNFKVNKLYATAHSYGQNENYHSDDDNINDYIFCLYINDIKNELIENADGKIFFKMPNLQYNICYEPLFNRGILFPSNYIYKSVSFSRDVPNLRLCIIWKLQETHKHEKKIDIQEFQVIYKDITNDK